MNVSPTLTAEEFRTIHNAVCQLDFMVEKLVRGNVHEGQKLAEIARALREGLQGAYRQDHEASDRRYEHYRQVGQELGLTHSTWSVYEVDNMADRHPFEGADRVVYRDHWGERPVSCSIHGLTWAALWMAANACIRDSGDSHHAFIEAFRPSQDDPRTLVLSTGS